MVISKSKLNYWADKYGSEILEINITQFYSMRKLYAFLSFLSLLGTYSAETSPKLNIDLSASSLHYVNTVDARYASFTFDWWGRDKPGWENSGLLNLDLNDPDLRFLFKSAGPAYLRIGGSLADTIKYKLGREKDASYLNCVEGINCLNETRFDEILELICGSGYKLVFGINELYGRESDSKHLNWNSTNAETLLLYVYGNPDYRKCLHAFQLGNELHQQITPQQAADDYRIMQEMIQRIWVAL